MKGIEENDVGCCGRTGHKVRDKRRKLVMYDNGIELLEFARVKAQNSNFVKCPKLHSSLPDRK